MKKKKIEPVFAGSWLEYSGVEDLIRKTADTGGKRLFLSTYDVSPIDDSFQRVRDVGVMAAENGLEIFSYSIGHELGTHSPDALEMKLAVAETLGAKRVVFETPRDNDFKSTSCEFIGLRRRMVSDFRKAVRQCRRKGLGILVRCDLERYYPNLEAVTKLLPHMKAAGAKILLRYKGTYYNDPEIPKERFFREHLRDLSIFEFDAEYTHGLASAVAKLPEGVICMIDKPWHGSSKNMTYEEAVADFRKAMASVGNRR